MSAKRKLARQQKRTQNRKRLIVTAAVLLLAAAIAVLTYHSVKNVAGTNAVSKIAKPASAPAAAPAAPLASVPAHISTTNLKAAEGSPFKLADFSGKVLVLNLWATWCGPCRKETPELVKLYKEFRPQGVEMIGLSTEDPGTSAEGVRKFINDFKVDYKIGWATPEVGITLQQGREVIPQSFVISRDGRILKRFVGFNATNTPVELRQAIEAALNDKG